MTMPIERDHQDLDEIDGRDHRGRGAEAFERRDDAALGIEIGAHRIGNANTADDQCGKADEGQELREAGDVRRQRRCARSGWSGSTSRPDGNFSSACRRKAGTLEGSSSFIL